MPKSGPYATLARILYRPDGPNSGRRASSTLLLIKPRIAGRELPDLIQYRETNAAFPQQPTTNQFFDEAPWESYYRLGQLIGERIFDCGWTEKARVHPGWRPWELEPLADADTDPPPRATSVPRQRGLSEGSPTAKE